MKDKLNSISDLCRQWPNLMCILVAGIILTIDYLTGRVIRFPIVYVLPVGMAAWLGKKYLAYALALCLPLARLGFYLPWHETQAFTLAVLNALIVMVALSFYAYLVCRIAWQTRLLKRKVRVLEGILPVCASCKRIRTEKGDYEQIEKYISEHSEASFSHGICPECSKRLYPEYFTDEKE